MTDMAVVGSEVNNNAQTPTPRNYLWTQLTTGTKGLPVQAPGCRATGQMVGTFGAAVVIEGSDDGTNYYTLKDRWGNAVSLTAAGQFDIANLPAYTRPNAGAITGVTVSMTVSHL